MKFHRHLPDTVLAAALLACVANAPAADAITTPPPITCKMTAKFPDKSTFTEPCLVSVVLAGQEMTRPKGWIEFLDPQRRDHVFNVTFFPPNPIKVGVTYTVTTDTIDSFLNGIVQPADVHQLCRMNKKFLTTGTVLFTAVGSTAAEYHGSLQLSPACYLNLGTPQQSLVPGGKPESGAATVDF